MSQEIEQATPAIAAMSYKATLLEPVRVMGNGLEMHQPVNVKVIKPFW
jgi:hypothetical protein